MSRKCSAWRLAAISAKSVTGPSASSTVTTRRRWAIEAATAFARRDTVSTHRRIERIRTKAASVTRAPVALQSDQAEGTNFVALGEQLLGGDANSVRRERVVFEAFHHAPAVATAENREPELQALGYAVLAVAHHRERVELIRLRRTPHAVD